MVGAEAPPRHNLPPTDAIELRGLEEDAREPLSRYAVFVCPILSGSGVRVKLLEAFAARIPAVSTRVGAEGLARTDGEICALADDPEEFAGKSDYDFFNPALAEKYRADDQRVMQLAVTWQSVVLPEAGLAPEASEVAWTKLLVPVVWP